MYPDIPQQPNFLPPFNGADNYHHQRHYPAHHGPTPLQPFGIQMPANRLDHDQQPAPFGRVFTTPRPYTAAERLQSLSFADGLGRRLLSMIGIDTTPKNQTMATEQAVGSASAQAQHSPQPGMMDETMRALQNSSVLQQLNRGVNSIYGGLSKMYNSTVQEQLNLLQERFKAETANSTNPWHQRMAQQVPQFFKQMTGKVVEAQEQLNRVWRDVNNGSAISNRQSSFFNSPFIDQISSDVNGMFQPGGFFNNMGRSLGFNGNDNGQPNMMNGQQQPQARNGQPQRDLMGQMREFWATQVQPQLGMVRNQAARVWRDLTSSGALTPETIMRSRSGNNNNNMASPSGGSNAELVDNILKEVDMSNSEYTLIEPKGDGADANNGDQASNKKPEEEQPMPKLSPQMQNGLINVQRELNQVWMGLTNSLQNALNNVKRTLNPGPTFATMDAMASSQQPKQAADPAQSEIDGKIKNLSKLQRDTDMVYDAVQQQQREAQQRQTFGDRFKTFFNNVDFSGMEQLPNRVGESVSRFGTVMGDLWNQIPERWDNLMSNMRPQQPSQADMMAKLRATSTAAPKAAEQ